MSIEVSLCKGLNICAQYSKVVQYEVMMFEWTTKERTAGEKNPEWYLAIGVIAVAIAVTSIIFNNVLLAIIIGIGFVAIILSHRKEPQDISVSIGSKGIRVNEYIYAYDNLEAFDVNETKRHLILKSKKFFSTHIIVPLVDEVDGEELEDFLLDHVDQEEMHENVFEQFMEYLGF